MIKHLLLLFFLTLSLHASPTFVEARTLYEAGEYKQALRAFQELAANDPDAAHMLAKMYEHGEGCEAHEKEALKWYKVSSRTYYEQERHSR
jgi:TPR repeat protein